MQMRQWVGYAGGALNGERSADGQAGERLEELFAGRHFNHDVIILCMRWYLPTDRRNAIRDTTRSPWPGGRP